MKKTPTPMMPKKSFRILIISEESGVLSSFQLSRPFLKRAAYLSAFFALLFIAFFSHYLYMQWSLEDRRSLEEHNSELAQRMKDIEGKLAPMEKQIRQAQRLSQKLLLLTTSSGSEAFNQSNLLFGDTEDFALSLSALKEMEAQQIESRFLSNATQTLSTEIQKQVLSLSQLVDHFQSESELRALLPSIHPVRGPLTSPFGIRTDPYTGEPANHTGADFAAPEGTVVVAPASGRVIFFGADPGLGNLLVIDHGLGYQTQFGHLKESLVEIGTSVKRGQPIAQVGNTGKSTGPHLHYEIRKFGIPVNPMQYMID